MVTIIRNDKSIEDRSRELLAVYTLLGLLALSACIFLIPIDVVKVLCVFGIGALIMISGISLGEVNPSAKLDLDKDILEVNGKKLRLLDLRIVPEQVSIKLTPSAEPINVVKFFAHQRQVAKLILSEVDWLDSEIPGVHSYFVELPESSNK